METAILTRINRTSTLFALWTIQAVFTFAWLALLPSSSGSFSAARLGLMGFAGALALASAALWKQSHTANWPAQPGPDWLHNLAYLLALLACLLPPSLILVLRALGQTTSFTYSAYATRLTPLAAWFSLAGLEWGLATLLAQKNTLLKQLAAQRALFRASLLMLLLAAGLATLMIITRWGLTPTRDGSFGAPPTPVLEWQLALAILAGALGAFLLPRLPLKRLDLVLFLLIYLGTLTLWLTDPLIPGFFATPPRAPNYEPYPFSDGLIYAQYAQSALVGEGLRWPDIPTRPMYVSLLVWMHALAGQSYTGIITLQTLWLACFPAVLYLLGRELGSRPLGLMLALLAALRDMTTNHAAPFALNYSYSKLYFSETPTALLLALFTLLALRWIKARKPAWYPLMMGGLLGAATLIRLQSAVLLAPLALVTIFPLWKMRRGEWLRGLALMTLGLVLMLTPWLARNYRAAGGLVVDNPISQSMVLAWRWSGTEGRDLPPQQPGESTAQFTSRLTSAALGYLRREPGRILGGAANHFFNNLRTSLLILPIRDELSGPGELIWPEHAFWQTGAHSLPLTVFYLLLFCLGLGAAWSSLGWAGLLPLGLSLGYHAWTALFLSSGDRFLIPIDWSWMLYDAWGLLVLARLALIGLRADDLEWMVAIHNGENAASVGKIPAWGQIPLTAALILLGGASLPLSEIVFPKIFPAQVSATGALSPQTGELLLHGRAIYPRYYEAGDGEPGSAKQGYGASPEARLVFWLSGPRAGLVILPLEAAPGFFPHTAEVWVVGGMEGEALRARLVQVSLDGKLAQYEATR